MFAALALGFAVELSAQLPEFERILLPVCAENQPLVTETLFGSLF